MNFLSRLTGRSTLKERKSRFSPENNWKIVRKLQNPICGDHFLVQNTQTGEIVMKKIIGTENDASAAKMDKNLKIQVKMDIPTILTLLDYDLETRSDLCSKLFYFSLYYDYPEKTLGDMLMESKDEEEDLSHETLLQLFYDVAKGLKVLSKKNAAREQGRLQLNRVYRGGLNFKVIENMMNHKVSDLYMNLALSRDKMAILAPELLSKNRPAFDKLDLGKLDTFNLGLIILVLGLKKTPKSLYTFTFSEFKQDVFEASCGRFRKKYAQNPLLVKIVDDLLEFEPSRRKNLDEIIAKYPSADQVSAFIKSFNHRGSKSTDLYENQLPPQLRKQTVSGIIQPTKDKKSYQGRQTHANRSNQKNFNRKLVNVDVNPKFQNQTRQQGLYNNRGRTGSETLPIKSSNKAHRYNPNHRKNTGHTRVKSNVVSRPYNPAPGGNNNHLKPGNFNDNSHSFNSKQAQKSESDTNNSWLSANMNAVSPRPGVVGSNNLYSPNKGPTPGTDYKFFNSPSPSLPMRSQNDSYSRSPKTPNRRFNDHRSTQFFKRSKSYNENTSKNSGSKHKRPLVGSGNTPDFRKYRPSQPTIYGQGGTMASKSQSSGFGKQQLKVSDDHFFG